MPTFSTRDVVADSASPEHHHVIRHLLRVRAFSKLAAFVGEAVRNTTDGTLLDEVTAAIWAAVAEVPTGEARWVLGVRLAPALRRAGCFDQALTLYEQVADDAEAAACWSCVGWICDDWARALRDARKDDRAREICQRSAEAHRRGGDPRIVVLARELNVLTIEVWQGHAAAVLPAIEASLDELRTLQQAGKPVAGLPNGDMLLLSMVSWCKELAGMAKRSLDGRCDGGILWIGCGEGLFGKLDDGSEATGAAGAAGHAIASDGAWSLVEQIVTLDPVPAIPGALEAPSSIAVLPFLDLSASHDQNYLCEGIAEEILLSLTHAEGLRVAARSSSFALRSGSAEARTAGARLGVDNVLAGSLHREGDRLSMTVQLVDVLGGIQRWSHRFDGGVADVFAIQDEVAQAVATLLRGAERAFTQGAPRRPATTPEAYEHFLRGRRHLRDRGSLHPHDPSFSYATSEFKRAVAIDPTYAPAYAALARVHIFFGVNWSGGGEQAIDSADRASAKAVELGPELAETHIARAVVLARRDNAAAQRECEEALRCNPQSFAAYYHLAGICKQAGEEERAAEAFRRGADIQTDDFQCLLLGRGPLHRLGRHERARAWTHEGLRRAERVIEIDPTNARALMLGARAWDDLGEPDRAKQWERRFYEVRPPPLRHRAGAQREGNGGKAPLTACRARRSAETRRRAGAVPAERPETRPGRPTLGSRSSRSPGARRRPRRTTR